MHDLLQAEKEGRLVVTSSNIPLTSDELREMGGNPYWHVGLRKESPPPHWAILDTAVAQHPEDYQYGDEWLAFYQETNGETT